MLHYLQYYIIRWHFCFLFSLLQSLVFWYLLSSSPHLHAWWKWNVIKINWNKMITGGTQAACRYTTGAWDEYVRSICCIFYTPFTVHTSLHAYSDVQCARARWWPLAAFLPKFTKQEELKGRAPSGSWTNSLSRLITSSPVKAFRTAPRIPHHPPTPHRHPTHTYTHPWAGGRWEQVDGCFRSEGHAVKSAVLNELLRCWIWLWWTL